MLVSLVYQLSRQSTLEGQPPSRCFRRTYLSDSLPLFFSSHGLPRRFLRPSPSSQPIVSSPCSSLSFAIAQLFTPRSGLAGDCPCEVSRYAICKVRFLQRRA